MPDHTSLFSAESFQDTMRDYCVAHSWTAADINEERVKLRFEAESGNTQTLYIIRYETLLEFSVPSRFSFASEDKVPHRISTLLLSKNSTRQIGFWCLEEIQGEVGFSIMHNQAVHSLDVEYFGIIARVLVDACDEFEREIDGMVIRNK